LLFASAKECFSLPAPHALLVLAGKGKEVLLRFNNRQFSSQLEKFNSQTTDTELGQKKVIF
jgi:hypothetical protein